MTAAPFSGGPTMQVAVKVVPKLAGTKGSTKNKAVELDGSVAQEIHILTLLAGAPGVVQFLSWTTGYFDVHLAFHMYTCSLHDYIERGALKLGSNGEADRMPGICTQLLVGLDHVHGLRIVHRDLKPSNILVDESKVVIAQRTQHVSPKVVIADFGGASQVSATTTAASFHELSGLREVTTRLYRAPELFVNLRFCSCTYATDVWAMGVTVVQMDLGDTPFVSEKRVRSWRTREIFVQMLEVLFQAKADAFDDAVREDPSVFNSKLASCKLLESDALPWGRSRSVSFRDFMRRFFTPYPPSRPLAGTLARDKALA
jgi:serine/threonine protein kinase